MFCLDTNIIIDFFRGDEKLKSKLDQGAFCITPIILAELFKGAHLAKQKDAALKLIHEFSNRVTMLEFDEEACEIFGNKFAELSKKGTQTQEADLIIASIAMAHNASIVTRNQKDFEKIPGLTVVKW